MLRPCLVYALQPNQIHQIRQNKPPIRRRGTSDDELDRRLAARGRSHVGGDGPVGILLSGEHSVALFPDRIWTGSASPCRRYDRLAVEVDNEMDRHGAIEILVVVAGGVRGEGVVHPRAHIDVDGDRVLADRVVEAAGSAKVLVS